MQNLPNSQGKVNRLWGSNGTSIYKTETDVLSQDLLAIHQHSTDQAIKACI